MNQHGPDGQSDHDNFEGIRRRDLLLRSGALFAVSALAGGSLATATSMPAGAQAGAAQPKPATEATKAANRALQQYLNFNGRDDFDNATRGLIAKPDTLTIKNAQGNAVWDLESYKAFISVDKPAPDTVNPSLWRNEPEPASRSSACASSI
jgi:alkyl sulfatase BDS1-like metallo-beta-lactamase superfamily hydrolase